MAEMFRLLLDALKPHFVLLIVLAGMMMFLTVLLMYAFPFYLYIAVPKLPHIDMTPTKWVGVACALSVVFGVLSWKRRPY